MGETDRTAASSVRDANWLPHRYDATKDAVHFVHADRHTRRAATFLTDEYLPADLARVAVDRRSALAFAPPPAPVHFIFHSAFCCSTLLANAFDVPGVATTLKEPMILNDLVGFSHRGGDAQRRMRLLDDALTLLARPFAQREAVIVKPSNITSGLIEAILTLRPQATALLLHAPIAVFLGSIAKKGMWGRLWVRTLFLGLARDDLLPFDYVQEDYLGQTDLQIAAICWLAQQALFARLVNRFGTRIRTLDSEDVTGQPVAVVDRMAALFGVQVDAASIAASDAFTRHSKSGTAFGAAERAAEVRDAGVLHADEIEKVVVWAKAVSDGHGLAMVLPSVLLR